MKKSTKQIQKFKDYLETQNLRLTTERQLVLEQSLAFQTHFRADDLLFRMIANGHKTSKATIYRTLPLLVKSGLLSEIIDANNNVLYEFAHDNTSQHAHLICIQCSQIIEFQDPEVKDRQREICHTHNFQAIKYRYEILGYCSYCR